MAEAIVLDSSAIMAGLNDEPGSEAISRLLDGGDAEIMISPVNLCEVVTKLTVVGMPDFHIKTVIDPLLRYCVPFDSHQAIVAGELTRKTRHLGLSLGDRVCLSLAMAYGATAWTTDLAWKKLDVGVKVRLLRGE